MEFNIIKLALELAIFLLVLLIGFILEISKPVYRHFSCREIDTRYPYKSSTVSDEMLGIGCLLLGLAILILVELIVYCRENRGANKGTLLYNMYHAIYLYLLGTFSVFLVVNLIKIATGRLRPHFFEACLPKECLNLNQFSNVIVGNATCTQTDPKLLKKANKEARKSFPSGHAAIAAHCAFYLILFIERRVNLGKYNLIKVILYIPLLGMALWIAITRYTDYQHHASDIVAGFLFGALAAVFFAWYLPRQLHRTPDRIYKTDEENTFDESTTRKEPMSPASPPI